MEPRNTDKAFSGSIPELYETYLVPLIFEPYAADLASRLKAISPANVLELAAGTGVVTRAMASRLPGSVAITATDLNQAMLDRAIAVGTERSVEWRQADAMEIPFADESFDVVVCQFGFMFFPDKPKAFSEALRVLRPGGSLIFNVWDRLAENEFAESVETATGLVFPDDPPRFLSRTPYGYFDHRAIEQDVADGGFSNRPRIETIAERSRADTPRIPAIAYCQGTPLRAEIETRDVSRLEEATNIVTEAIYERFGAGAVDAKIQAHVVTVEK